ncbi:MAG: hypothetical protein GEV13_10890 [Rhodospirillales bacterium]|nr:hypothetical protein [Rhodospirillales bacterium]
MASLFGPLYVLFNGFVALSLLMFLVSAVIGGVTFGGLVFILLFFDSSAIRSLALSVVPIVALVVQGVAGVEIVRAGYMRRGWREGY